MWRWRIVNLLLISSNSCYSIPTQQYKHSQFVLTYYYVSIAKYALRIFFITLLPISPFDLCSFCPVWCHARLEILSPISTFDLRLFCPVWHPWRLSWDSLANLINLTPRCSSVSDEKLLLCLERFLWSLVCLCSCVSAALLSWSLFLRFLNLSSFSAAVSAARWARFYIGVFFLSQLKAPCWFS